MSGGGLRYFEFKNGGYPQFCRGILDKVLKGEYNLGVMLRRGKGCKNSFKLR